MRRYVWICDPQMCANVQSRMETGVASMPLNRGPSPWDVSKNYAGSAVQVHGTMVPWIAVSFFYTAR